MKREWTKQRVSLTYRLGEVELFKVPLRAVIPATHSTELGPDAAESPPRECLDGNGAKVAVISSCPVDQPLPRLAWRDGAVRYVRCHFPHYWVEISGDFETYLKTRNKESRKKMQRAVRRYEERAGGKIPFREYREPGDVDPFFAAARVVSEKTFQERLLNRGLPDTPEFLARTRDLAGRGLFRGFILFDEADQHPVAYLYAPVVPGENGDVLISDIGGYDPGKADSSPGMVLRYLVLRRLFEEKAMRVYDLGEGDGPHKHRLATHRRECAEVYFFRPNLPNMLIVGSHLACELLSLNAGRLLGPRAKAVVKRALRRLGGAAAPSGDPGNQDR